MKLGKAGELKDFADIVKKSESAGGLMVLVDSEGVWAYTYFRPSGKQIAKPVLVRIERILNHYFKSQNDSSRL